MIGAARSAAPTKATSSRLEPSPAPAVCPGERTSIAEGFRVWRPGLLPYREAQARQEELVASRPGWTFDLLVLLEHPPVVTFGRSANPNNLLRSPADLRAAGVDCVSSRRGGDVTLHGPGQLVGYPIVDLNNYQRDLHRYLRSLENILIETLADHGLKAEARSGATGVWVGGRKIASIGIAVRQWISYHGFALNIDNDLAAFDSIVPCGLPDVVMTSMREQLGRPVDKEAVVARLIDHFGKEMQRPLLGSYDDPTSTQA